MIIQTTQRLFNGAHPIKTNIAPDYIRDREAVDGGVGEVSYCTRKRNKRIRQLVMQHTDFKLMDYRLNRGVFIVYCGSKKYCHSEQHLQARCCTPQCLGPSQFHIYFDM